MSVLGPADVRCNLFERGCLVILKTAFAIHTSRIAGLRLQTAAARGYFIPIVKIAEIVLSEGE